MGSKDFSYEGSDFDKDLDVSFEEKEPKRLSDMSAREIVTDSLSGSVRGVHKTLSDSGKWLDSVRDVLPKPFKETWKAYDETSNSLSDLHKKATKDVKPLLGQLAKTLDNLVPAGFQRTKNATSFLKEKFYEAPSQRASSPEEIREQTLKTMLGDVFKDTEQGQTEVPPENDREKKAKKILKVSETAVTEQIEKDRHDQTVRLFSRIDTNVHKLNLYQERVGITVQRKGLELSFRKYTLLADIVQQLRNSEIRQTNQLSAITTNTSLPETKKIYLSDRFKENAKRRLTDSVHNKFFGKDSLMEGARKKIAAEVNERVENFKSALEMGLMGIETAAEAGETVSATGDTAPKAASDFGGQIIGEKIRKKILKKVMPEFNNDPKFLKFGYQAGTAAINPNYGLSKIEKSETFKNLSDGKFGYQADGFMGFLKNLFSIGKGDTSLEGGYSFKGALDPENQTKRLNIVQTEVVPGYLARILREVTMHRTGKEDVDLVEFDPTSGDFSSSSVIAANVEKIINDEARSSGGVTDVKNLTTVLRNEMGFKEDSNEALVKLITSLAGSSKEFNKKAVIGSKAYETGTEEHRKVYDKIADRLDEDSVEKHKLTFNYESGIKNVRAGLESGGAVIQQLIDAGLSKQLISLGIINKGAGGKYSVAEDPARERVEKSAMADSDVELKEGFKGFSGKKALAGIKNLAISAWKYKDQFRGKGQKIGPMAQDLNKELGEEIAPGGKKVDLVSANGTNMAAIQELAKEQDEIKKELHGEYKVSAALRSNKKWKQADYLNAINENIISLHETLKKKSFGFGVDMGTFKLPGMDLSNMKLPDVDLDGVKEKAKSLVDPLINTGNRYIDTVQSLLLSGIRDGGAAILGGLGSAKAGMRNFWDKHKDGLKDKAGWLFSKVVSLTGKALSFGSDVLFKHIPAGVSGLIKNLVNIKDKAKVFLNGPVDVYIKGNTSPVLLAARMRAGIYACSKTGKIIKGVDDLLSAGCDIIDISNNNEVALRWSDSADGLFDQNGKQLRSVTGMVTNLAAGAAVWMGKKLAAAGKWAFTGPSFLGGLKETLSTFSKSISNFFSGKLGFSFTDIRQVTLLAQIRDLTAIGKDKKLLDQVYNRDLKDERHLSGSSFLSTLLGDSFTGFMEAVTGTTENDPVEAGETKTPPKTDGDPVGEKGKPLGVLEKIKNTQDYVKGKGGLKGVLSNLTSGVAGSESFVGPLRPGEAENGLKGFHDRALGRAKKGFLKLPGSGLVSKLFNKKNEEPENVNEDTILDGEQAGIMGPPAPDKKTKGFFKKHFEKAKDKIKDINKTLKEKGLSAQDNETAGDNENKSKVTVDASKDAKEGKSLKGLLLELLSSKNKNSSKNQETDTPDTGPAQSWGSKFMGKVNSLRKPKEVATPPAGQDQPQEQETTVSKPSWRERFRRNKKQPVEQTAEQGSTGEPKVGMMRGMFNKAKGLNYKGILGGAASLAGKGLGMLFGGGGAQQNQATPEGTALGDVVHKSSTIRGLGDGSKGKPSFNDKDGDGERDGGSTEQLKRQEEDDQTRKERNATKAAEVAKAAQADSLRYKSSENALSGLISGATSLVGFLATNASGLFRLATGVLGKIPGLGAVARGVGKLASGTLNVGKNLVMGAARGVAGAYASGGVTGVLKAGAGIAARGLGVARTVGLAAGGTTALLTGSASLILRVGLMALGGPVGWALTAATLGVWAYKYFTRNSLNDFEKLRAIQYGMTEDSKDLHKIMELEGYFLDGRISYSRGIASINNQKAEPEDLLEIMGIDKEDKERATNFNTWMVQRFQPFFLNHLTALFSVDPKRKLEDVEKLEYEPLGKYLDTAQFLSGPYDVSASPFASQDSMKNTKEDIPKLVESLKNTKKPKDRSSNKKLSDTVNTNTESLKNQDDKKKKEEEAAKLASNKTQTQLDIKPPMPFKPVTPSVGTAEKIVSEGMRVEDGGDKNNHVNLTGTYASEKGVALATSLNKAKGPLYSPAEGAPFISLSKGAKLDGLNPSMRNNLLAMAAEYGQLTDTKLILNDGFRTEAEQAALFATNPNAAAPRTSMHEFGLAVDIDKRQTPKLEAMGLMRKYGFTRPVGGEPWHVEAAGVQMNHQKAKKEPGWASQQIDASPGRGGGGFGSIPGSRLKGRDNAMAKALFEKATDISVDPKTKETVTPEGQSSSNVWKNKSSGIGLPNKVLETPTGVSEANQPTVGIWKNKSSKTTQSQPESSPGATLGANGSEGEKPVTSNTGEVGAPKPIKGYTAEFGSKASNDTTFERVKTSSGVEKTKEIIAKAAERAGLDPKMLQLISAKESSMGQNLKSGNSNATGPFQFMPGTWKEQIKAHGNKYGLEPNVSSMDVNASALMTAEYLKSNTKLIQKFKPTPDVVDYYLSHMLGPGGVQTFLKMQPEDLAASNLPAAAKNNADIFFKDAKGKTQPRTVGEIRQFLVANFNKLSRDFGVNIQLDPGKLGGLSKNMKVDQPTTSPALDNYQTSTDTNKDLKQKVNTQAQTQLKASSFNTPKTETLVPSYENSYPEPEPIQEKSFSVKKQQPETLRGQPEIASGVTAILQRGLETEEKLLSVVQNEMVPVLQRMYDTLEKIYAQAAGQSKAGSTNPAETKPTNTQTKQPGILASTQSVLDRVRKYG